MSGMFGQGWRLERDQCGTTVPLPQLRCSPYGSVVESEPNLFASDLVVDRHTCDCVGFVRGQYKFLAECCIHALCHDVPYCLRNILFPMAPRLSGVQGR